VSVSVLFEHGLFFNAEPHENNENAAVLVMVHGFKL
jgi:hypothetical protein